MRRSKVCLFVHFFTVLTALPPFASGTIVIAVTVFPNGIEGWAWDYCATGGATPDGVPQCPDCLDLKMHENRGRNEREILMVS